MKKNSAGTGQLSRLPRGFTMVELLVVIVIIVILIGLLVPAVGAVRRIARETASKAVLQTIETGLEAYKADSKLGGAYPPSFSDADPTTNGLPRGHVISPYVLSSPPQITVSGAGLLVWALSGADLLGTPGFPPLNVGQWSMNSGAVYSAADPTAASIYALDPNGQPTFPRYGPYVDASKLKVTRNEGNAANPKFVIPEELKILGTSTPSRAYPLYLDNFGYPVLYWRADPAGKQMADRFRGEGTPNLARGIYHSEDNAALLTDNDPNLPGDPDATVAALTLNKAGEQHLLGWSDEFRNAPTPGFDLGSPTFPRYIRNNATKARYEPARPSSFLLASPGFDGRYGTADDVTNFEAHGQ